MAELKRIYLTVRGIVDATDATDAINQIARLLRDDDDSVNAPVWSLAIDARPTSANTLVEAEAKS